MTRWQANVVIVFVALIWGTTFVVQQTGMENIGPQYFTGVRFLLGTLVVSCAPALVGLAGGDDVRSWHLYAERR